ncbi:MAG TPA: hypothetical protein VF171_08390, partial [Trueperaceae bacterium]
MSTAATPQTTSRLEELRARLHEVHDLRMAGAVLSWDQSTYMPPGGAAARGRQMATLSRLAHEKFTDPALGRLLEQLDAELASAPEDTTERRLVRVTRRDFERAQRVPASFLSAFTTHSAEAFQVWAQARPANNFGGVQSLLEKTLDLSRQYASYFPEAAHPADPLIDESDEGMSVTQIRPLFEKLQAELVPLLEVIGNREPIDDSILRQSYPEEKQLTFGLEMIRQYGYDFERGRQDKTHHPFCTSFSVGDVRI